MVERREREQVVAAGGRRGRDKSGVLNAVR